MQHNRLFCLLVAASTAALASCAFVPPPEPPTDAQLWRQNHCFAHILPPWTHVDVSVMEGVVRGNLAEPLPVPGATVLLRRFPNGPVLSAVSDEAGVFRFPGLVAGLYEVSVCQDGWNPWRGTVRVAPTAPARSLEVVLSLGN
ncbi:MAG: carboxypeptidase regulatory-like domain-containing protein [Holophagales bacterium]|nr:carboxypeptidase regulatory-like domain-containing protein [Holophagales bacterium]